MGHVGRYVGYDFSEGSIEAARQGNRTQGNPAAEFHVGDISNPEKLLKEHKMEGATLSCQEVLEHMEDDLEVLENIPKGTRIILSVPMFDETAHVRWFETPELVYERYGSYFSQWECERIASKWRAEILQCHMVTAVK